MADKRKRGKTADKAADVKRDDASDDAERRSQTSNYSANSTYRTVMTAEGVPMVVEERGAPQGRAARRR